MQRTVKKAIVTGAFGLAIAGALTVVAAPAASATPAGRPVPKPRAMVAHSAELPSTTGRVAVAAAVAETPKRAARYTYSQTDDTVTVYQRGRTVAKVRLTS